MPAAVIAAVSLIGAEVGSAAMMMYAVEIGTAIVAASTLVYGQAAKRRAAGAQRRAQDAARAAYIAGLENKLVTSVAVDAPVRYVYGRDKVGCNIVAMLTSGTNDQYRHLVCVVANHEITSINEVYINSKPIGYANLSTSTNIAEAGWVSWNGDSTTEVIRGGNGTFKLPAGYGNLAIKASTTTDFTAGTTLVLNTNYTVVNDVVSLIGAYATNTYYIQLTFSPNAFFALKSDVTGNVFTGPTYTIPEQSFSDINIIGGYGQEDGRKLILGTEYTVSGNVVTMLAPWDTITNHISYTYVVGTPMVKIDAHLGAVSDTYDAYLNSVCPGSWTPDHKLSGHAYLVVTLDLNLSEFQGGPPEIQVDCYGKKLYDPRTATTVWSDNPALVIRDYLLSPLCKIPSAAITAVNSSYIAAANACEVAITINGASADKYTVNGVITADEASNQVLEGLAQSMAGLINGSDWSVTAGTFTASVMSINHMDDVVGTLSYTPGLGRSEIANTVKGRYTGLETKYVPTDIKAYVDSTYRSLDGEEIAKDLTFNYTNMMQRCHNLAAIDIEDSRNGLTLSGEFSYKVWALRPGDRIQFTSPSTLLNMSAKTFRVTDKSFQFGGPIKLTLKEDQSSIWDQSPTVTMDYILSSLLNYTVQNTYTSNIFGLAADSGDAYLVLDSSGSIVSRIYVSWTDTVAKSLSSVEVQYKRFDDDAWVSVLATGATPATYLSPVEDGVFYHIRARIINTMTNTQGPWANITHTVQGKTASPTNVDTFDLSFGAAGQRRFSFAYTTSTKPLDWAGVEIRYTQGTVSNPAWDSMTKLHEGIVTQSPYEDQTLYAGSYTFALCSVDTTGNYSTTPIVITASLPSLPDGNILTQRTTLASGWSANGWFLTQGKRIGNTVEAPTNTWSSLGTTWVPGTGLWSDLGATWGASTRKSWGNATWDSTSTLTQIILQCSIWLNAPMLINVGLLVDAIGNPSYSYYYLNELGSTEGPFTLTPDTGIYTTSVQVNIIVDGTSAVRRPIINSAVIKLFGERRTIDYIDVSSSNTYDLSLVGNLAVLANTDVAHIDEIAVRVQDTGSWTWATKLRQPTANPGTSETSPYVEFYNNGIAAMPSVFTLTVKGYGTRTLNGPYNWS